jgi:hypothetical protein
MHTPGHIGLGAQEITMDQPKAFNLRGWRSASDVQRLAFLRDVAERAGRDPRLRSVAARILRDAGVDQRRYREQAAALLKWVQENIQYLNEPDEIIQDPLLTLRYGYGDCDDMAALLGSLYEAIRLDWRFVLAGTDAAGNRARWTEGTPYVRAKYAHIYVAVGWPPFKPMAKQTWAYAEPTVKSAPLGWDVHSHAARTGGGPLPEVDGGTAAAPQPAPGQPDTFARMYTADGAADGAAPGGAQLPAPLQPIVATAVPRQMHGPFDSIAASVSGALASDIETRGSKGYGINVQNILMAIGIGVATSVLSQVVLDVVRKRMKG